MDYLSIYEFSTAFALFHFGAVEKWCGMMMLMMMVTTIYSPKGYKHIMIRAGFDFMASEFKAARIVRLTLQLVHYPVFGRI